MVGRLRCVSRTPGGGGQLASFLRYGRLSTELVYREISISPGRKQIIA